MTSYDIIVVGGGVIGMSAAYHLAKRGGGRVLLLERHAFGSGSTSRATGGFRCQFGSDIEVRLSLLSRRALLSFAAETGVDPGYDPVGYLFLAEDENGMAELRKALAVQHSAGLEVSREVGLSEIAARQPLASLEGVLGGTFCPWDGYLRPRDLLEGYRRSAVDLGVALLEHAGDVRLLRVGDRVTGVGCAHGDLNSAWVVNAAGAWAAQLARGCELELPVVPLKRQVAVTRPVAGLSRSLPMTVFVADGFHFRVRDDRLLLLRPDDPSPAEDPYDASFDPSWLGPLLERARSRLPILEGREIDGAACWAGLYEMSPDRHALLGAAPGVEGLFLVNGSSGHGVMHAPALGLLAADLLLDGATSQLDVAPLRPSRFAEGRALEGSSLL